MFVVHVVSARVLLCIIRDELGLDPSANARWRVMYGTQNTARPTLTIVCVLLFTEHSGV